MNNYQINYFFFDKFMIHSDSKASRVSVADRLFSLCSDLECDLYILTVCCPKISNLLCFAFIVLQRHHCQLPNMLLWMPE